MFWHFPPLPPPPPPPPHTHTPWSIFHSSLCARVNFRKRTQTPNVVFMVLSVLLIFQMSNNIEGYFIISKPKVNISRSSWPSSSSHSNTSNIVLSDIILVLLAYVSAQYYFLPVVSCIEWQKKYFYLINVFSVSQIQPRTMSKS